MGTPWRKSIRKKLILLFTANTAAALGIAYLIFWAYLTLSYRNNLVNEEEATAQMLGESSTPALAFDDHKAARDILAVLRAEPRIVKACLYSKEGILFAAYRRNNKQNACPDAIERHGFHFTLRYLFVSNPVLLDGEAVGELFLQVGLEEMYARIFRFGAVGLISFLVVSLFAMLFSLRLQRGISEPILHLTKVASQVSADGNYSIRATIRSDDEIGVLIGQFNAMMEQIHHRDVELQKAQDELEARVEERTLQLKQEIAEREIIQQAMHNAKLEAEAANHAKSEFLANMSHELRTPLNAILGYSEMLEEDEEAKGDSSAVSDLRRIQSAGHQLLTLIGEVLDLSKIEAGSVNIYMEFVLEMSMINDVSSTIEPLAMKNGNRFSTTTDDANAIAYVDVVKFRQCLLNLLSNACKFTENGEISLTVRHYEDESGKWSIWAIRDSGIGIAAEDQKKLFRPFSQVDASATRRHGGTGLGLAISQRLIQMMGGRISVESESGWGATFSIHIPVKFRE